MGEVTVRVICLLGVVSASLSCRAAPPADPVILALGEDVIRRSEFDRHVAGVEARTPGPLASDVREALLQSFLEERVLVLEARARRLIGPQASVEEEQRAAQRLLAEAVPPPEEVSEEEVARYWAEHGQEFRTPETVTVRQIVVPTENEARDVRRRLQKDPRSFEILARSRSRSPEASEGGLLGSFSRGQLPPALEAAAFSLPMGGTSEIVTSPLGYHVLRVEAREEAREPGLEECRGRIRTLLHREKSDQSVRQFIRDLMARAKVNHEAAKARPRHS